MDFQVNTYLASEWQNLIQNFEQNVRRAAIEIASANKSDLATYFYDIMLQDPIASSYLTHDQVKNNLHASLQTWVVEILDLTPESDFTEMVIKQNHIGLVHARVKMPVHVVLRGARALKVRYSQLINNAEFEAHKKLAIYDYISLSIDFAMEIASSAYSDAQDRNARAQESYRLFALTQDINTEKAMQRTALLEWENAFVYEYALSGIAGHILKIGESNFGLWFKHKGAHIFHGSYEAEVILNTINNIDEDLLPQLTNTAASQAANSINQFVSIIRQQVSVISKHLERLFEQRSELEIGRDALTRLLSRRFLDVILTKEITYARQAGSSFALVGLDIDYFKQINDTYGHEAGDLVLQQLAIILSENTRGGDYVFRLGGEEFLIVAVDVNAAGAELIADKLRKRIMNEKFKINNDKNLQLTVSIGVAVSDGHPDHARLLRRMDDALYKAKNSGRNSVVFAEN